MYEISKIFSYVDGLLVRLCELHGVFGVVEGVLPLVQEEGQPQLAGGVLLEDLLDGDEVLERLGHLAPGDRQVARVQEVPDPVVVAVVRL